MPTQIGLRWQTLLISKWYSVEGSHWFEKRSERCCLKAVGWYSKRDYVYFTNEYNSWFSFGVELRQFGHVYIFWPFLHVLILSVYKWNIYLLYYCIILLYIRTLFFCLFFVNLFFCYKSVRCYFWKSPRHWKCCPNLV